MSTTITTAKGFREKRVALIEQARALYDEKKDEEGNLPAEYRETWDKYMSAANDAVDSAKRLEAMEIELETDEADPLAAGPPAANVFASDSTVEVPLGRNRDGTHKYGTITATVGTPAYRAAFDAYLRGGRDSCSAEQWAALRMDDSEQAGFLAGPEQMAAGILRAVDDMVQVRQWATIHTVRQAASLGIRKRTAKANTMNWSDELQVSTADTALKYGKKALFPRHITGEILVSRDLIRNSVIPIEQEIRNELARDAGETMETAYMTGDGSNQPLGLFTASADGISTARDVDTGSTTNFTADQLIAAKYTLKPAYRSGGSRPGARWLFHRDGMALIAQLKDANNQYLLRTGMGLREDDPDMMLGHPVHESEFVPNTFTAALYVGILGNFAYYEIADSLDIEIQVLQELSARTNQVSYIARLKTDGLPTLEEAFVRLKTDAA